MTKCPPQKRPRVGYWPDIPSWGKDWHGRRRSANGPIRMTVQETKDTHCVLERVWRLRGLSVNKWIHAIANIYLFLQRTPSLWLWGWEKFKRKRDSVMWTVLALVGWAPDLDGKGFKKRYRTRVWMWMWVNMRLIVGGDPNPEKER